MKLKQMWKRFWTMDVHNHAGFTLVELIIVIAILAILSTGAIAGYSAYIEKAKEAADMNLLSAYNTAINAACSVNGVPVDRMQGAVIELTAGGSYSNLTNIPDLSVARSSSNGLNDKVKADFETYLGDNATIAFQFYGQLRFNNGAFEGIPADEVGTTITGILSGLVGKVDNQVAAINGSTFGTIGAESLMNKVVDVTGMATDFATDSASMRTLLTGNKDSLAKLMGYTGADDAAFTTYFDALVLEKAKENNPDAGRINSDMKDAATWEILSNYAVLSAAQSTAGKTSAELLPTLQAGISSADIKNMLNGGEGAQEALTNSAMMYAMYTAYANSLPEGDAKNTALENASSVSKFATAMSSDAGFKDYLNGTGDWAVAEGQQTQVSKDLEGYLGAMDIINQSATTENKTNVEDLIMNGYSDEELVNGLNGLLGK